MNIQDLLAPSPSPVQWSCFHPRAVQKSYGSEKRLFTPPPLIVQNSSEPFHCKVSIYSPQIKPEEGFRNPSCSQIIGDCSTFKNLWVSSSNNKSKVCRIQIETKLFKVFSKQIDILSKPSKKTSQKISKLSCFIQEGALVSFFNRIHSQNCRTQFLGHGFQTFADQWSPFYIFKADSNIRSSLTDFLNVENEQVRILNYNQQMVLVSPQVLDMLTKNISSIHPDWKWNQGSIRINHQTFAWTCHLTIGHLDAKKKSVQQKLNEPIRDLQKVILIQHEHLLKVVGESKTAQFVSMEPGELKEETIWTMVAIDCMHWHSIPPVKQNQFPFAEAVLQYAQEVQ